MILLNKFIKNYIQLSTAIFCGPSWGCNNYAVSGKKIFCYTDYDTGDLFCIDRRLSSFHLFDEPEGNSFEFRNGYISISLSQRTNENNIRCYIKDDKFNVSLNGETYSISRIEYHFYGYTSESLDWYFMITLPQFIEQYNKVYYDKNLSLLK